MMHDYIGLITRFIQELRDNPRIELDYDDFYVQPEHLELPDIHRFHALLTRKYGPPFPLPFEDRQLVALPRRTDVAWGTREGQPLAGGTIEFQLGCLALRGLSTAMSEPTYERPRFFTPDELAKPAFRMATMLESGSSADITKHYTFLLRDEGTRTYHGLALIDSGELLSLPLTIGEYVRTALRWYGAWGWQFLYLSLADFRALHGSTLVTLYKLRDSLPELFPHADWSIIDEKREYFDWAKKYKR